MADWQRASSLLLLQCNDSQPTSRPLLWIIRSGSAVNLTKARRGVALSCAALRLRFLAAAEPPIPFAVRTGSQASVRRELPAPTGAINNSLRTQVCCSVICIASSSEVPLMLELIKSEYDWGT